MFWGFLPTEYCPGHVKTLNIKKKNQKTNHQPNNSKTNQNGYTNETKFLLVSSASTDD